MNYIGKIKTLFSIIICTSVICSCSNISKPLASESENNHSTSITYPQISESAKNFYVVSDLGRNGYYSQKKVAALLGDMAEEVDIEFVAALGDTHHYDGVQSVNDPLWMTNYEMIYSHPELMLDWFAVCGNHEYRGNTQALIDYSQISRRWNMPSRYYSVTVEGGENEEALLVFIDTPPLISKYREDNKTYPDAQKQNMQKQLEWIDETLSRSDAKWKIVMGHHPIFAYTTKSDSERIELQNSILPILEKNNVDAYLCGHIHSAQHIKPTGSKIDYFVNTSGSLSRSVEAVDGTRFCSSEPGFMIVSMEDDKLSFLLINENGENIYKYSRTK